jgi:uncharacterized membrane protein YagU involved in acid resistance
MATRSARVHQTGGEQGAWLGLHVKVGRAVQAGLLAGSVFLALELLATAFLGERSPFGPAYATLHGLAGAEYLPGSIDPILVAATLVLHFTLSVVLAFPLGTLINSWRDRMTATAVGAVFGITLYFINMHLFGVLMPVLESVRDPLMLINYGIFGALVAWFYSR